jgi:hypothetical protein
MDSNVLDQVTAGGRFNLAQIKLDDQLGTALNDIHEFNRFNPVVGMRSCGVGVGVAAASSLLAWRLAVLTGSGHNTLHANAHHLLSAGRDVIVLLASFAAIAAAISLTQARWKPQIHANDSNARQAGDPRFVQKGKSASCAQRRLQ